jgi:hypothetical protein
MAPYPEAPAQGDEIVGMDSHGADLTFFAPFGG